MNERINESNYSVLSGNFGGRKSAGGTTETAGGREQGSINSFRHSVLPLYCPLLFFNTQQDAPAQTWGLSFVERKADTKPLLIKKLLQLELSSNTKCPAS